MRENHFGLTKFALLSFALSLSFQASAQTDDAPYAHEQEIFHEQNIACLHDQKTAR